MFYVSMGSILIKSVLKKKIIYLLKRGASYKALMKRLIVKSIFVEK